MKLWVKIFIAGAIVFIIAFVVVYVFIYNKPHADYEKAKPDFVLTAGELYNAFIENRAEAEAQYNGKVVLINGEFSTSEQSEDMVILSFSFSDGLFGDEGVRCTMLENHQEEAMLLKPGNQVTVKGLCTGFTGHDVIMEFCSLR
jgi:hypothetical protein